MDFSGDSPSSTLLMLFCSSQPWTWAQLMNNDCANKISDNDGGMEGWNNCVGGSDWTCHQLEKLMLP